jgi:hypothetical protein
MRSALPGPFLSLPDSVPVGSQRSLATWTPPTAEERKSSPGGRKPARHDKSATCYKKTWKTEALSLGRNSFKQDFSDTSKSNIFYFVRFKVFTAVTMKNGVF